MAKSIAIRNLAVGDTVKVPNAVLTTYELVVGLEYGPVETTVITENPMNTFHVAKRDRVTAIKAPVPGLVVLRQAQPWEGVGWIVETRSCPTPHSDRFTVRAQADSAFNALVPMDKAQNFAALPVYAAPKS